MDKDQARNQLLYAVRKGYIIRPGNCDKCGSPCIPQGHHPDYNKPLEVIWVCVDCHNDIHHPERLLFKPSPEMIADLAF